MQGICNGQADLKCNGQHHYKKYDRDSENKIADSIKGSVKLIKVTGRGNKPLIFRDIVKYYQLLPGAGFIRIFPEVNKFSFFLFQHIFKKLGGEFLCIENINPLEFGMDNGLSLTVNYI